MTNTKREQIEVVTSKERRMRWAPSEKKLIVQEIYEPGVTVSLVARRHGIATDPVDSLRFEHARVHWNGSFETSES